MKFKIAAAQIRLGDTESHILKKIRHTLQAAKKKGVSIVCFPECSLTQGPKRNQLLLQKVANECKLNQIWCIVVGHLREAGKVYNFAVLIDSDGKIAGKHKKVHICDAPHVCPGTSFEVFETPFGKIGMAICWDINHPEPLYYMAKKGARLIFCPMYWNYELWAHHKKHLFYERKLLESLILARAYENLIYVVFCNPYDASHETLTSFSAIAEPHRILKQIFNKEGLIISEIDVDSLEKTRKKYYKEYCKKIL